MHAIILIKANILKYGFTLLFDSKIKAYRRINTNEIIVVKITFIKTSRILLNLKIQDIVPIADE